MHNTVHHRSRIHCCLHGNKRSHLVKEVTSKYWVYSNRSYTFVRRQPKCYSVSKEPGICTKHIDIQYHFIREKFESREIDISYISTDHQLADIMTKALPQDRFERFRNTLPMASHTDIKAQANQLSSTGTSTFVDTTPSIIFIALSVLQANINTKNRGIQWEFFFSTRKQWEQTHHLTYQHTTSTATHNTNGSIHK